MKSLFVCSERNVDSHVGEWYDSILEVSDQPNKSNIEIHAREIRKRIRDLWEEDKNDDEVEIPSVSVYLHAASPFNAMLIDYRIVMEKEEGISVNLPYMESEMRTTEDPEANRVIKMLNKREGQGN